MEKITMLLEKLAVQLGTTVEYLWSVLVKQALISGITNLVLYLLLIIAIIAELRWFKFFTENYDELCDDGNENAYGAGLIIGAFMLMVCAIIAVINLESTLASFFNPEYWALQKVLSQLGGQ